MAIFALTFKGSNHLKQKLILATISGKTVQITDIRRDSDGLQEFEINVIRLIDKLTNGTKIKISRCGTELEFSPGILHGGKIEHLCCVDKSIGELNKLRLLRNLKQFSFKFQDTTSTFSSPSDHSASSPSKQTSKELQTAPTTRPSITSKLPPLAS